MPLYKKGIIQGLKYYIIKNIEYLGWVSEKTITISIENIKTAIKKRKAKLKKGYL